MGDHSEMRGTLTLLSYCFHSKYITAQQAQHTTSSDEKPKPVAVEHD